MHTFYEFLEYRDFDFQLYLSEAFAYGWVSVDPETGEDLPVRTKWGPRRWFRPKSA